METAQPSPEIRAEADCADQQQRGERDAIRNPAAPDAAVTLQSLPTDPGGAAVGNINPGLRVVSNSKDSPESGGGMGRAPGPEDPIGRSSEVATGSRSSHAQHLSAVGTALVMGPLCLSSLLSALDLTIVTPAIPSIVGSLESAPQESLSAHTTSGAAYIWIGGSFILAHTAATPIWGSVSDIWGRKPVMLAALGIFLAGSLLCALAPHTDALVGGRAVQGLGASGMGMMVKIIICDLFSLRDRALYLALTQFVWAVGNAVGPVVGGLFTTRIGWRWCFWINLPIGGVVLAVLAFFLHVPNPRTPLLAGLRAIDWPGSTLIIGGALMILLGLQFGDVTHPWSSATVVCLIVFGAVVIGVFILNEWKLATNPLIPLRLFRTKSTVAAFSVMSMNMYVFIGLAYYLPLYSQSVLGADALQSALHLLPLIVSTSIAGGFAGWIIQKTGKYLPIMYAAQVLSTLGVGLLINLKMERDPTKLFIYEVLVGMGVGMNMEGPLLAAQAAATALDTAAVIATMDFLRAMATAVSVVVAGVIFQNRMNAANPALVRELGADVAGRFNGSLATANVEFINALSSDKQTIVREAYFEASKSVWIMYIAFAGVSAASNLFIRTHHLGQENQGPVLGVNRTLEARGEASAQSLQHGARRSSLELGTIRRRQAQRTSSAHT